MINVYPGHTQRVGVVAWSNNTISSGSKDCVIISRDIRCNNVLLSANGNYESNDMNSNNIISRLYGHNQEVCGLKWSFDGTQLASGGNDNKLILWSNNTNTPLMINNSHVAAVKAIAWSPHQHNVLVTGGGTADRTIRFWNTSLLCETNKIDTGSQVCNLVFSKSVNQLVSTHGFSLNQIILWKLPSLTKLATLVGHTYRVLYLGISPDGQNIVTGAADETLRFWNVFPPKGSELISNLIPNNMDLR